MVAQLAPLMSQLTIGLLVPTFHSFNATYDVIHAPGEFGLWMALDVGILLHEYKLRPRRKLQGPPSSHAWAGNNVLVASSPSAAIPAQKQVLISSARTPVPEAS